MKSRYLAIALAAIILASLYFDASLYLQTQSQIQPFDPKTTNDYKLYNSEFGVPPTMQQNYSFSTPVPMYHAIRIALESDDWNKTSLEGMKIQVSLDYIRFTNSQLSTGMELLQSGITEPTGNFSAIQIGSNTYRYIWNIYVSNATATMHPYGIYYVDAATAQIIPHGPIY